MTSNERERLDSRLEWLERGIIVAGGIVVVGLLLEYFPEISRAVKARRIFPEEVIGGILVTIGVFFEVLLGIFVTRDARRSQEIADSVIAETNERAMKAERDAAEANLETARLRAKEPLVDDALLANAQAALANSLGAQSVAALVEQIGLAVGVLTRETLSEAARPFLIVPEIIPFAGTQFDVTLGDVKLGALLGSLRSTCRAAGWIEVETGATIRREQSSFGNVTGLVEIRVDANKNPKFFNAAETLSSALNSVGIPAILIPITDTANANLLHLLIIPRPPK